MSVSTVYDDVVGSVFEDAPDPDEERPGQSNAGKVPPAAGDTIKLTSDEHSGEVGDSPDEIQAAEADEHKSIDETSSPQDCADDADLSDGEKVPSTKSKPRRGPRKRKRQAGKKMSDEERLVALRRQIEYYLSDENLRQDTFFYEKISANEGGWLDASWILGCNRVKKLGVTTDVEIESSLRDSACETQMTKGCLQVRRQQGQALPPLLAAGWLAKQVQDSIVHFKLVGGRKNISVSVALKRVGGSVGFNSNRQP